MYQRHANNVLFNPVAPTQQQRYFVYQQPAQYVYQQPQAQVRYQPQVQYIQQPVQYLQYQQPVVYQKVIQTRPQMREKKFGDWRDDCTGLDAQGNLVMTSNPVEERPRTYLQNQYYTTLAWNEYCRETAEAQQLKKEKFDKIPLSKEYDIFFDQNGNTYEIEDNNLYPEHNILYNHPTNITNVYYNHGVYN